MSSKSFKNLPIALLLLSNTLFGQKELLFENAVYEPQIKTVQLHYSGNTVQDAISSPIVSVNQKALNLSFDDLSEDADYYNVYFIHCNADWSESNLRPNMYMDTFNEFEITNFEFSAEAKKQYVHYSFDIPSFRTSGNYLAVVYRDRNKKDIVLSQQFYVYEEKALAGVSVSRSSMQEMRFQNQRVEVTLNYTGIKAVDPRTQFTVVVKQNQRPDLIKFNLPPTYVDENSKVIRYQNLGEENEFPGTNEFRSFDLGTVTFSGRNVQEVYTGSQSVAALLRPDAVFKDAYLQALDINGQFYIRDLEGRAGGNTAEYVNTTFTLKQPESSFNIYVVGEFNSWRKDESSQLKYNPISEAYMLETVVKQGWYNYSYITDGTNPFEIDGNYFDTENQYEVFVYYLPMGGRGDELVAYSSLNYNTRR